MSIKLILENWRAFVNEEDSQKVDATAQALSITPEEVREMNNIAAALAKKGVTSDDIYVGQEGAVQHIRELLPLVGIEEDQLYDKDLEAIQMAFPVPDDYYDYDLEEEYLHISDGIYEDGSPLEEDFEFWDDVLEEAEYQGRKVTLNKPMQGDVKKSKVYVKDPSTGNVKKVNFGDPNMRIKKSNPARRKSFRARHNCANPGPKTKARYWSCKAW